MPEQLFGFEFSIESKSGGLLVLEPLEEKKELIHHQMEMITNNSIPGLLNAGVRRFNQQIKIYYKIDQYVPLNYYIAKNMLTAEDLFLLVNHLKNIIIESKKYLLNQNYFVLVDRYIYVKEDLKDIALIYIPSEINNDINEAITDMLINMIEGTPGIDNKDGTVIRLIKFLKEGNVTIHSLDMFIKQFFLTREEIVPSKEKVKEKESPAGSGGQATQYREGADEAENSKHSLEVPVNNKLMKKTRLSLLGILAALATVTAALSILKDIYTGLQSYYDYFVYIAGILLIISSAGAVFYIYIKTKEKAATTEVAGIKTNFPPKQSFVPVIYKKADKNERS